jgi:hypothetical protein
MVRFLWIFDNIRIKAITRERVRRVSFLLYCMYHLRCACATGTDRNYLTGKERGHGIILTHARLELIPNKADMDFFG